MSTSIRKNKYKNRNKTGHVLRMVIRQAQQKLQLMTASIMEKPMVDEWPLNKTPGRDTSDQIRKLRKGRTFFACWSIPVHPVVRTKLISMTIGVSYYIINLVYLVKGPSGSGPASLRRLAGSKNEPRWEWRLSWSPRQQQRAGVLFLLPPLSTQSSTALASTCNCDFIAWAIIHLNGIHMSTNDDTHRSLT